MQKKEKTMELLDFQFREEIVNEDKQNNTLHKVSEHDLYKPSTSKGFSDSMHKPGTSKYSFYETDNNSSGVILNEAEISSRNLKSINESSANEQQLEIEPEKVVKKKKRSKRNKKSSKHSKCTTTTSFRIPVLDPESRPAQRIPLLYNALDMLRLQYAESKKQLSKTRENIKKIKKRKMEKTATTK